MPKRLLIDALHPEEMRVVIADDRQIFDFDFVSAAKKQVKGNIYLAKITRVEPSLQAAFVEYGGNKQGFLPFAEIHPDYYQIPVSDRKKLLEEAESNEPDETENAASSHGTGIQATLGDAPAEHGAGYDAPLAEDTALEGAEDGTAAALPDLPQLEEIPESAQDETESTDETAERAQAERGLAFTTSEVVGQDTVENEQLATQLSSTDGAAESATPEAGKGEGVETLANEEEEISSSRKRQSFSRRYKIQEVIKRGQIVLVQVIKEERGNKGVSLTTFLSLAGRYCVLMPNSPRDGGVSRKINDGETRRRLKDMMSELKLARGMSVIIRTAGIDRTRAEIRRDFDYLVKLWNKIRETTLASTAPSLIYEETDLVKRAIRDLYTNDIDEVVVQGDEAYQSAHDFMKMLLPSHTPKVKHYTDSMPIFYAYGVEDQLLSMHDPVVKLRSGGYLVINPTEALISIDVNSGRSTAERNIEETATKTNLEAVVEIARQLRLRDLAGLIVLDLIDMMESRNRRNVERALKDALRSDRAKIQIGRISPFGLLEMSRQRLRPSVAEANMVSCPHCAGRGHVRSNESLSIQIARALEKEAANGSMQLLKLNVPAPVALYLLNAKRALLSQIEERYGVQVSVAIEPDLAASAFTIERTRRSQPRHVRSNEARVTGDAIEIAPAEEMDTETTVSSETAPQEQSSHRRGERGEGRRRGRRGGRGRSRRGGERPPRDGAVEPLTDYPPAEEHMAEPADNALPETAEGGRPQEHRRSERGERGDRGRRGGRGRRRWRGEGEGEERHERPASQPGAESLPAFTRESVVVPVKQPQAVAQAAHQEPVPTTSRPAGQPPRKGWWQKIIELE